MRRDDARTRDPLFLAGLIRLARLGAGSEDDPHHGGAQHLGGADAVDRSLCGEAGAENEDACRLRPTAKCKTDCDAGSADLGQLGQQSPAILADQGATDVKVIFGYATGAHNLIVRKAAGIKSWKDLEGKTIGRAPGHLHRHHVHARCAGEQRRSLQGQVVNTTAVGTAELQALKSRRSRRTALVFTDHRPGRGGGLRRVSVLLRHPGDARDSGVATRSSPPTRASSAIGRRW